MTRILHLLSLISVISIASSCSTEQFMCDTGLDRGSCKKTSSAPSDNAAEPATGGGVGGKGGFGKTPTMEVTEYLPGSSYALTRITPESMSLNKATALNYSTTYASEYSGQTHDYFVDLFGVGLGGVDYRSVLRRDPRTRAQTLLIARLIAWSVARDSVGSELGMGSSSRVIFSKCVLETDRPFISADASQNAVNQQNIRAGELRWIEQVKELFWRLYSRPITNNEMIAVRLAFVASYGEQQSAPLAWIAILYAMISAEEFWHI